MLRADLRPSPIFSRIRRRLGALLALVTLHTLFIPAFRAQPSNLIGQTGDPQQQIFAYIYLTPAEVRCEILLPLSVMERWLAIPRARRDRLEVAEQEAALPRVQSFFSQINAVEIDGLPVTPVLQSLDFDLTDTRDPGLERPRQPVAAGTSWVGAVLSYNTAGSPQQVQLHWGMLDAQAGEVTALIFAFDQQNRKTFRPEDAVFQWTSPRSRTPKLTDVKVEPAKLTYRLPALSILALLGAVAAGARGLLAWQTGAGWRRQSLLLFAASVCLLPALPIELPGFVKVYPPADPQETAAIFETLHKNVYRAFDYQTESDVYDALARSVSGELLRKLYQDIRQGVEMKEQGRAISRVSDVRIVEGKLGPPPHSQSRNTARAFRYAATWTVSGTVGHWGHTHERTNRYQALFTVELVAAAWKITALEILREERLEIRLLN
jgi:hypothetical protein